jgi:hypothetical protein
MIQSGITLTVTADERQNKKNAQRCFAQKNTAFNKTHPDDYWVASLKMTKKWIKKCSTLFRTKNTAFNHMTKEIVRF